MPPATRSLLSLLLLCFLVSSSAEDGNATAIATPSVASEANATAGVDAVIDSVANLTTDIVDLVLETTFEVTVDINATVGAITAEPTVVDTIGASDPTYVPTSGSTVGATTIEPTVGATTAGPTVGATTVEPTVGATTAGSIAGPTYVPTPGPTYVPTSGSLEPTTSPPTTSPLGVDVACTAEGYYPLYCTRNDALMNHSMMTMDAEEHAGYFMPRERGDEEKVFLGNYEGDASPCPCEIAEPSVTDIDADYDDFFEDDENVEEINWDDEKMQSASGSIRRGIWGAAATAALAGILA